MLNSQIGYNVGFRGSNKDIINNLPEVKLAHATRNGDKSILHVGMNSCGAARIMPNGIKTIYTDGLNGCNGILAIAKGLDGNPIAILSHYTPLARSVENNLKALETQLGQYSYYIDPKTKPLVLFHMPGDMKDTGLLVRYQDKLNGFKSVFAKHFRDFEELVIPYIDKNASVLDSSALIAEFGKNPANLNEINITTVGKKVLTKVLKTIR